MNGLDFAAALVALAMPSLKAIRTRSSTSSLAAGAAEDMYAGRAESSLAAACCGAGAVVAPMVRMACFTSSWSEAPANSGFSRCLDISPPGLYPDEAMDGNNALSALHTGDFKVFYPPNNGVEGLYANIEAMT